MNSKVGNLAKLAPQIWDSEAVPKQLNLNKLSDADGFKDEDTSAAKTQILKLFRYISIRIEGDLKRLTMVKSLPNMDRSKHL